MSRSARPKKTNAARALDTLGIRYELRSYEVDPADLSAPSVAAKIGLPAQQVYKTLVVRGDRCGVCLAVVPGDATLDLAALAALAGDKKVALVPVAEIESLTGYIRGGVTALACKHEYPVYADSSIEQFSLISVSAGLRGVQILLDPKDYIAAVHATLGPICQSGV